MLAVGRLAVMVLGVFLLAISGMMVVLRREPSEAYWVAYISGDNDQRIETIYSDGSHRRVVFESELEIDRIGWSPDCRWLSVTGHNPMPYEAYSFLIRPHRYKADAVIFLDSNLSYLTWSPDSRQLAFISTVEGQKDVFVANRYGKDFHRLTNSPADEHNLGWSPDGQWIYYRVNHDNYRGSLSRISVDGTILQLLTPPELNVGFPVWSPDGQWIAFDAFTSDTESFLFRMRSDGTELEQLGSEPSFGYPKEWSPKNDWFVFDGDNSDEPVFYLIGTDGTNLHTVPAYGLYNNLPQWSADGNWILFEAWDNDQGDIYRMRPDGSELVTLSPNSSNDGNAAISPLIDLPFLGKRLLAYGIATTLIGIFGMWMKGRRP